MNPVRFNPPEYTTRSHRSETADAGGAGLGLAPRLLHCPHKRGRAELKIVQRLKNWYRGPFVPPLETRPGSPVVFLTGHHVQPPLAKLLGILGRFWLAHWQWVIGTILASIGLLIAWRG